MAEFLIIQKLIVTNKEKKILRDVLNFDCPEFG